MKFGAFPLRANGDTVPLGVRASSPGPGSPKCRGTFNDCGVTRRASGLDSSPSVPNRPVLPAVSFCNGRLRVSPRSGPQSPLFVLLLMVAPLLVVVTVGLFLTL